LVDQTQKKTILIVDDEPDTRIFLCNILGTCGFEPVDAGDKQEGMQMARRTQPALIIIDAMMPGDEGIEMYRELRGDRQLSDVPVIMVSTVDKKTFAYYHKFQTRQEILDFPSPGAYVEIPVESDQLIEMVRALISEDHCRLA
jgi:DNA-binding response OmpR family regulator